MDMYVLPETVVFRGIEMMEEVSYNSTIDGYFRNNRLSNLWYHTEDRGGGEWHRIQDGNYWFRDEASMGDELILPCSQGTLVWHIPISWRGYGEDDFSLRRLGLVNQTFTMTPAGTLRVSKYQYWVERTLSGHFNASQGVAE